MGSKFLVSVGLENSGMYGGLVFRMLSQSMAWKNGCCLKSAIPFLPSRTFGSQISLWGMSGGQLTSDKETPYKDVLLPSSMMGVYFFLECL